MIEGHRYFFGPHAVHKIWSRKPEITQILDILAISRFDRYAAAHEHTYGFCELFYQR